MYLNGEAFHDVGDGLRMPLDERSDNGNIGTGLEDPVQFVGVLEASTNEEREACGVSYLGDNLVAYGIYGAASGFEVYG